MMPSTSTTWTPLRPALRSAASREAFASHAQALAKARRTDAAEDAIEDLRTAFAERARHSGYVDAQALLAAGLVITDLAMQGWQLRVRRQVVEVCPPLAANEDRAAEKARIRRQELVKRDAQLRQPAVQAFLRAMERTRLHGDKFVSIFSLMRDGRELAEGLRAARGHRANGWAEALSKVVDPYLEFVTSDTAVCPHTGLRLMDVWRYFRHTWTNQYTSVPGRSMLFLVRDRAAAFHPVVGIGALCSPIMQLRERDAWIGWQPETFLARVRSHPTAALAQWLDAVLDAAIREVYVDDLIEDGILTALDLVAPRAKAIERLLVDSSNQRQIHHRCSRQRDHKRRTAHGPETWIARARSHLFRSKRALALATYLRARTVLRDASGGGPLTAEQLAALAATPRGSDAIRKILRKAKADRVGICVADISVCGAVQPYNAILGGKLVAMLAASPEVVQEYRRRYGGAESEIASAMAGRPVVREPNLVLLGTTSLYGVGSSQYNRIRVPCERIGGSPGDELRYAELGHSEAFGTSQYSDETVDALTVLARQSENGARVNSIFGEGVSPKLRKIRHGLELLDLPSDLLLKHHRHRIVYAVSLVRNLGDYLLGLDAEPKYLVPFDAGSAITSRIAAWWRERWLRHRIESDDVLAEVERHTLVRPVRHGARVIAPASKHQPALFAEPF
jgi:hypothetical protein